MRFIFSVLFAFNVFIVQGQHKNISRVEIINSVVIKERKQDVVRLEILLSSSDKETDTLYFYKFYKHIPSIPFVYNLSMLNKYKYSSLGLSYIIEDSQENIIEARDNLPPSFVNMKDELNYLAQINQVNEKTLKIKKVKLNHEESHDYHLSKLMLAGSDTITLFPLLSSYHNLKPGMYKLYLFYSFNETVSSIPCSQSFWDKNKPNDFMIFKGSIISNKIDLIIK